MKIEESDEDALYTIVKNNKKITVVLYEDKENSISASFKGSEIAKLLKSDVGSYIKDKENIITLDIADYCWCCGRKRLRMNRNDNHAHCFGKPMKPACKYTKTKLCKEDGNCKGQDKIIPETNDNP